MSFGVIFFAMLFQKPFWEAFFSPFFGPKRLRPLFPKTADGCKEASSMGADTWQRKGGNEDGNIGFEEW